MLLLLQMQLLLLQMQLLLLLLLLLQLLLELLDLLLHAVPGGGRVGRSITTPSTRHVATRTAHSDGQMLCAVD